MINNELRDKLLSEAIGIYQMNLIDKINSAINDKGYADFLYGDDVADFIEDANEFLSIEDWCIDEELDTVVNEIYNYFNKNGINLPL